MKKIPAKEHYYHAEESQVHTVEPTKPGPSFGTIFSKFFSASSSFNPKKPEPFGVTAPEVPSHEYKDSYQNEIALSDHETKNDQPVDVGESSGIFDAPPAYLNENLEDYSSAASQNNLQAIKSDIQSPSKVKDSSNNIAVSYYKFIEKNNKGILSHPNVIPRDQHHLKQALKSEQSSQNIPHNSFTSSLNSVDTGNLNIQNSFEASGQSFLPTSITGQNIASPVNHTQIEQTFDPNLDLPNIADFPNGFPPSTAETQSGKNPSSELSSYLKAPEPGSTANFFQPFPTSTQTIETHSSSPSRYLETPRQTYFLPTVESNRDEYSNLKNTKQSIPSIRSQKSPQKPKFNFDLVQSISYKLGPNGPTRLT